MDYFAAEFLTALKIGSNLTESTLMACRYGINGFLLVRSKKVRNLNDKGPFVCLTYLQNELKLKKRSI